MFHREGSGVGDECAGAHNGASRAPRHSARKRRPWRKVRSCYIAECQKLIRIADRSDLRRSIVDEYVADELVDGSDDERHIEKAEKVAERKAANHRLKKHAEPPSRFGKA